MKRDLSLSKDKKYKQFLFLSFVCMYVLFCGSVTYALDPLGPSITNLNPGQLQLGLEYYRSSMDLKLDNGKWLEQTPSSVTSGTAVSLVLKDFEQNNGYVNIGYCIDYNWEIFFRLNRTKAEFGDSLLRQGEEFESDSKPAFGGGIKATLFEKNYLRIGGLVQANMASYSGQLNSPLLGMPHFIETDITEIQIAIGADYMVMDNIWIYGGPIMHFVSGEHSDTFISLTESDSLLLSEYTWDIEQDSSYGGYFGTQVEIAKNCYFNAEYQFTGGANAFGAGILFGF
jgi:hypothetical protein